MHALPGTSKSSATLERRPLCDSFSLARPLAVSGLLLTESLRDNASKEAVQKRLMLGMATLARTAPREQRLSRPLDF